MSENVLQKRVRAHIFEEFMSRNHASLVEETAHKLDADPGEVRDAYRALAAGHVIVLQGNGEILTANPYAAVPTPFVVETADQTYNGICIWDALGIVANVGRNATVRTTCGDCSDGLELAVRSGKLVSGGNNTVHISVQAKHWWDNIVFS